MPDAVEFQDANNTIHTLTDLKTFVPAGMQGRFMPTFTLYEDIIPAVEGSLGRNIAINPREVTVPVLLVADNESLLRGRIRDMASWLDPTLGPGVLRTSAPDGSRRELYCVYKSGHEGVEIQGRTGCVYYSTALVFHAYDPYWYDTYDTLGSAGSTATSGNFLKNPFFPWALNPSQIYGSMAVTNIGDAPTWPIWTITGPGTNIGLANDDGSFLLVQTSITAGQTLVIDTRPGYKTAKVGATSLFQYIPVGDGDFFQLHKGVNNISLSMTGTTAASSLAVKFRNRWNSA